MVDIGKILGKREEKYCLFFCFGMDSRFARRSNLNLFSISSRYLFRTRQTFQGIMTKYNHHLSRQIDYKRCLKRCVFSIYSYDKKQWNIYKICYIWQTDTNFFHYFWVRCTCQLLLDWVLDFAAITTFARYMQTAYRFRQTSTKNSGVSVCIF